MSTHDICFHGEIRKILCRYPILSAAMNKFNKILLLRPLEIKTSLLLRGAFISPKWFLSYYSIFDINLGPAEPGYALPLQTVLIKISWRPKKPTDLDLHYLSLRM